MRGHVIGMAEMLWAAAHEDADEFLQSGGGKAVAIGTLLAILSAVANGSFTIFSKTPAVKRANVDPFVFNFWACVGIVLSSLFVLVWDHFVWSPLGLLSGLFFVVSAANSYKSVGLIGVSVGTGIWSGTAVLVSFLAGLLLDPEGGVQHLVWAAVAIVILLLGVAGVAYSGHVGRTETGQEDNLEALLKSDSQDGMGNFPKGVLAAFFAGILGGLIMIPLTWAPESLQEGLSYLPSFGIGVAVFGPIVTFLSYATAREWPQMEPATAALPGIVSGIVWNIGNMLSILAISYISYSAAYPIMQTGIFVAGLWGMFLFQEIGGGAAGTYWLSGVVVLAGVGLLTWAN